MAWRMPSLVDMPMGLGDHLHELRRRLFLPLAMIGIVAVAAFALQDYIKRTTVWPLKRSVQIVGYDTAVSVGLVKDRAEFDGIMGHSWRALEVLSVAESTSTAAKLSLAAAIAVSLPILLWQIWGFVAVGLKEKERRLVFFFVPLGVIFFYIGAVVGYFVGLPHLYAALIWFTASDSTAVYRLRQSEYFDDFITWTICLGLIMDIPWLVMVLVRSGLMKPATIAKARRYVIAFNVVLAACITPEVISMLAMFASMQLLFESGLLASRFMVPKKPPEPPAPVASE
jgi:sec-independent protein translocase protein TatC